MSGALNRSGFPPTKTQKWFYAMSDTLSASFRALGEIEHRGTIGEGRERQILDVLGRLLPTRISVHWNVIIIDHMGTESPKFDGVLYDRSSWPLLFAESTTVAAMPSQAATRVTMIESILAAIETKSSLRTTENSDIFNKATALRAMRCVNESPFACPPLVTAFAYECPNTNLSFFDFAKAFWTSPKDAPSLICILNQGLFGIARPEGQSLFPAHEPSDEHVPIFYRTARDTLLVYLYFLSRWTSAGTGTAEVFRNYSDPLFSQLDAFYFERDFLDAICSGQEALTKARQCFAGHAREGIESLYIRARERLGLQTGRSS